MCTEIENRYELGVFNQTVHLAHKLPLEDEMQTYAKQGIKLVVSDVDSTLTDGHEGSVCPDANEMVQGAYDSGMHVAVVSNNPDRRFVSGVASKLDIPPELTFSPQSLVCRKPFSTMLRCAFDQAGVSKNEVLIVGDSVTDAIAGKFAGAAILRVVLTRPEEVGGYPFRHRIRSTVHGLGRFALPWLIQKGIAREL